MRRNGLRWLLQMMALALLAASAGCTRAAAAKESLERRGIEVHEGKALRVFRF